MPAFAGRAAALYLVRTIDPPGDAAAAARHASSCERGPFALDAEVALMRDEGIEVLVTKNSGGAATDAKLAAARELGLPVIMIDRPAKPGRRGGRPISAASCAWLAAHRPPRTERGV